MCEEKEEVAIFKGFTVVDLVMMDDLHAMTDLVRLENTSLIRVGFKLGAIQEKQSNVYDFLSLHVLLLEYEGDILSVTCPR